MDFLNQLRVAGSLFITDCKSLRATLLDKIINISSWVIITIFVNGYLLPQMGIAANYGLITFGGVLAVAGMFEVYGIVAQLIADLLHEKIIYYYATLPLSANLLFIRMIAFNSCLSGFLTLCVLPLGKLLLWNDLDLLSFNWPYFVVAVIIANIFYGAFSLFTASFVYGFHQLGNVWSRFMFPLWFLGGFMFPWKILYQTVPAFAYLDLLNPLIYISEIYRIVLLGQEGYLNFWLCVCMVSIFTILCGWIGIKRFKKRCDFI